MTTTELIANLKTSRAKMLRSEDPARKSDGECEILLSTDHVIEHLERLRADAERYRWLRERVQWCLQSYMGPDSLINATASTWMVVGPDFDVAGPKEPESLDAAIDAALSGRPPSE